ncbi:MAG: glycosyl hydrolase 108 family protein [Vicinamibacterales bacterium]|nr:glycosyl hydrolase 108 family protein [Vicinamibacterales bacterium]
MTHNTKTIAGWLERIIGHEGGMSTRRDDPGNWTGGKIGVGELVGTKWGIAANTYGAAVKLPRGTVAIQDLTVEDAAYIYRRDYVRPLGLDRYGRAVAFQALDFAVNGGLVSGIKRLQKAAGLTPDGVVGPLTRAKMAEYSEAQMVMLVLYARLHYLTGLKNWPAAGRGWARRVADNLLHGVRDTREA